MSLIDPVSRLQADLWPNASMWSSSSSTRCCAAASGTSTVSRPGLQDTFYPMDLAEEVREGV